MSRHLHIAPALSAAEAAAFERAESVAGSQPASVLYLAPSERPQSQVRDRWDTTGSPIQLQISDFDTIVADALERHFYETRFRGLSAEQRQRLVEAAVDDLDESTHPLGTTADAASADACSQAEDLLSLLEFAGLTTPETIHEDDRLQSVSSTTRDALATLSEKLDQRRGTFATGADRKTLRSERYQRVIETQGALDAVLGSVDVVVLGPFSFFSPLEAALVDAIADCVGRVHAVLPLAGSREDAQLNTDTGLSGINRGAERAWSRYADLGFTPRVHDEAASPGARIAHQLYRFTPSTSVSPTQLAEAGVEWHAYPTPAHEIRGTAQELRTELNRDREPDQIGVVVPGLADRRRELFETFQQYRIPVQVTEETAVSNTELGFVLEHVLRIGAGDGRVQDLLRVIDNPLVDPEWPGPALSASDLRQAADRAEATRLDALTELLGDSDENDDVTTAIDWLVRTCRRLMDVPATDAVAAIGDTLVAFGILDAPDADSWALADTPDRRSWMHDREAAALQALHRVANSLAESATLDDRVLGERLARALESTKVEATIGSQEGVTVVAPGDVLHHEFNVVFAVGLTQDAVPGQPRRLAFTREVNDAHEDFEPTNPRRQARHGLGLLPAQVDRLVLSHPAQTADGEETVVVDFLAELQRICANDLAPTQRTTDTHPPRCREDIQRDAAALLDHTTAGERSDGARPTAVASRLAESGILDAALGDPATRLQSGVECALARKSPETTVYDGLLSTQTVDQFAATSAPLSPSRIDTHATCGFKFYANYLLGYSSPDERTLEADARATGRFVHEVLARFFQSLQSTHGEPVTLDDPDDYQDALYEAAQAELTKQYIRNHDTVFHDGWLTRLLAGLTPSHTNNDYDGPPGYRGLFVRVLEAIADEHDQITSRPALFEAAIGVDAYDGEATTLLADDPVELVDDVHVRGKVDRVDIVPGTNPREFVAIDYKTGASPSIGEIRQGASFQLPLYLRLLDATLDDSTAWTPIGAAYYDLDIPASAGLQTSPLTTTDQAAHYRSSGAPLLRHYTDSLFDDRDAFHEFLFDETDRRLSQLAQSIDSGIFHPTLLDPDDANCEHCDYAHVCDVRHHQRHDRLDQHGRAAAYVPAYATPSEESE